MRSLRRRILARLGAPTGLTVTVYRDVCDRWRWRIQAPNGRLLAVSTDAYECYEHAASQAVTLFPQATLLSDVLPFFHPAHTSHPSQVPV